MTDLSVVFTGIRTVELQPQPRPSVPAGSVLLRNEYSLISPGSELAIYEGTHSGFPDPENRFAKFPHRPGYAAVGRVVACGDGVEAVKAGDRLLYLGRHESWSVINPGDDIWVRAPDDLPAERLLFARFVQIAATASVCFREPPERVVVLGAGLIGILSAQVLRVQGVKELVVQDVSPDRLALAKLRAGLRVALGHGLSLSPAVSELGGAPQAIIEATGVPALVPAALAAVRHRGEVVLLGSSRGSAEIDLYKLIHRKGATLVGAHEWMLPNRAPSGVPSRQGLLDSALGWLQSGEIKVDGFVTDRVRPDELPATYERISADKTALGIVVDWN